MQSRRSAALCSSICHDERHGAPRCCCPQVEWNGDSGRCILVTIPEEDMHFFDSLRPEAEEEEGGEEWDEDEEEDLAEGQEEWAEGEQQQGQGGGAGGCSGVWRAWVVRLLRSAAQVLLHEGCGSPAPVEHACGGAVVAVKFSPGIRSCVCVLRPHPACRRGCRRGERWRASGA